MSIGMGNFGSNGQFQSFDTYRQAAPMVAMFQVECHCCGYEPENTITPPKTCPKCNSKSWTRYARPGSILDNANRRRAG